MKTIKTLCTECASEIGKACKVKMVSRATTEKKVYCENCRKIKDVNQYFVQSRK